MWQFITYPTGSFGASMENLADIYEPQDSPNEQKDQEIHSTHQFFPLELKKIMGNVNLLIFLLIWQTLRF